MENKNSREKSSSNVTEFMTFELGKMKYAIELPKIKEILTYPDHITTLPNTSDWVKGLINSRGEVVPILDIRIKFNTGPAIYDVNTSIITVITEDKRMIGIVVDLVDDVQKIDTTMLAPVAEMGSGIPARYLKGYVRLHDNKMLVLMDIEKVVCKEELGD